MMERFDPGYICNTSDDSGRYSYQNQPSICKWNCEKLAEALRPFIPKERSDAVLAKFNDVFHEHYMKLMRSKLGLVTAEAEDKQLVEALLHVMEVTGADFTKTFRSLSRIVVPGVGDEDENVKAAETFLSFCTTVDVLAEACKSEITPEQLQMLFLRSQYNPMLLAQLGLTPQMLLHEIEKSKRYSELKSMSQHDKDVRDRQLWNEWIQKYSKRLSKEIEGKTSQEAKEFCVSRIQAMNNCNPSFILRNYIAQAAIAKAESGDFSEVQRLLELLQHPFDNKTGEEYSTPPEWACTLKVT